VRTSESGQSALLLLDVAILLRKENLDYAVVFTREGFKTELRRGDSDDPIPALMAVSDAYGNRVDLLAGLRGMDPGLLSRAVEVPFQGETLRVAGREDFIAMKLFARGPQDLSDARRAVAVSRETLNMPLLERLVKSFGRNAVQSLNKIL
jgi:hypothetical protein